LRLSSAGLEGRLTRAAADSPPANAALSRDDWGCPATHRVPRSVPAGSPSWSRDRRAVRAGCRHCRTCTNSRWGACTNASRHERPNRPRCRERRDCASAARRLVLRPARADCPATNWSRVLPRGRADVAPPEMHLTFCIHGTSSKTQLPTPGPTHAEIAPDASSGAPRQGCSDRCLCPGQADQSPRLAVIQRLSWPSRSSLVQSSTRSSTMPKLSPRTDHGVKTTCEQTGISGMISPRRFRLVSPLWRPL
jgi:hypothetical protein